MSKTDFDNLAVELDKIEATLIQAPNIPVDVYLQEAYDLEVWVKDEEKAMTKAGLNWSLVTSLAARAGALRYAQSVWMKERYSQEEAQQEWNEKSPKAYELKNNLEASYRFAFRKRQDLLNKVAVIEDGTGHADMVQDLSDLSVLGKANEPLLSAIDGAGRLGPCC